jgi:hypothetical protein
MRLHTLQTISFHIICARHEPEQAAISSSLISVIGSFLNLSLPDYHFASRTLTHSVYYPTSVSMLAPLNPFKLGYKDTSTLNQRTRRDLDYTYLRRKVLVLSFHFRLGCHLSPLHKSIVVHYVWSASSHFMLSDACDCDHKDRKSVNGAMLSTLFGRCRFQISFVCDWEALVIPKRTGNMLLPPGLFWLGIIPTLESLFPLL